MQHCNTRSNRLYCACWPAKGKVGRAVRHRYSPHGAESEESFATSDTAQGAFTMVLKTLVLCIAVAFEFASFWGNPARASVRVAGEGRSVRVPLEVPGRRLEIGRHLHEQARAALAGELTRRLRN